MIHYTSTDLGTNVSEEEVINQIKQATKPIRFTHWEGMGTPIHNQEISVEEAIEIIKNEHTTLITENEKMINVQTFEAYFRP
ncbi:hypothetical protein [Facklamia miroungae]|uniref:Uncharacterized protein n=1 Tax=Facklamia miroungae TaxID=120956 RepID=A0A1G7PXP6_9LACT|nr:hypothetical protein [Facklamia miroungae]NKZ28849.1 hypothetical protein [Facklamia miroungae]SDF90429.1 hypothetical protein SAMN05421791_101394 [Facklamia miroungae]